MKRLSVAGLAVIALLAITIGAYRAYPPLAWIVPGALIWIELSLYARKFER